MEVVEEKESLLNKFKNMLSKWVKTNKRLTSNASTMKRVVIFKEIVIISGRITNYIRKSPRQTKTC